MENHKVPPIQIKVKQPVPIEVCVKPEILAFHTTDVYLGETKVNPNFDTQTLKTRDLFVTDDIIVNPIKLTTVSNTSGGTTLIIGG